MAEITAQAIRLGQLAVEQSSLARGPPQRARGDAIAFPLGVVRRDVFIDEATHLFTEQVVVVAEDCTLGHWVSGSRCRYH